MPNDELELPPDGALTEYVDGQMFDGVIDSLDAHAERKKAVGHPLRYAIVYLLYEHEELSRKEIVDATGRDGNSLQHHLKPLVDNNLLAWIPAPEGDDVRLTTYRITTLGRQEIKASLRNIRGETAV